VILSVTNAYGRIIGAKAGHSASLYEYEGFLVQIRISVDGVEVLFMGAPRRAAHSPASPSSTCQLSSHTCASACAVPLRGCTTDNRPPQDPGAPYPKIVVFLMRVTGAKWVLQDLWHVLHHMFATCDSRLADLADAKRLVVDLVYERDPAMVATIDQMLREYAPNLP